LFASSSLKVNIFNNENVCILFICLVLFIDSEKAEMTNN